MLGPNRWIFFFWCSSENLWLRKIKRRSKKSVGWIETPVLEVRKPVYACDKQIGIIISSPTTLILSIKQRHRIRIDFKTHKKLKERFLFGRNRAKRARNRTKQDSHALSCFVQLKSVLSISCVFLIFFSERWQSALFQILFYTRSIMFVCLFGDIYLP